MISYPNNGIDVTGGDIFWDDGVSKSRENQLHMHFQISAGSISNIRVQDGVYDLVLPDITKIVVLGFPSETVGCDLATFQSQTPNCEDYDAVNKVLTITEIRFKLDEYFDIEFLEADEEPLIRGGKN